MAQSGASKSDSTTTTAGESLRSKATSPFGSNSSSSTSTTTNAVSKGREVVPISPAAAGSVDGGEGAASGRAEAMDATETGVGGWVGCWVALGMR